MNISEILYNQMNLVSFTGSFFWLGFILVFITAFYLYREQKYLEISFIIISLCSYFYSVTLKGLFKLPRPIGAENSPVMLDNYSFPSTHVVLYTVIFGFLFYLVSQKFIKDKLLTLSLKVTFGYLILLVGISRVVLGQHYARDVMFGYLFGAIYLFMIVFLYNRLRNAMSKDKKNNS
ncbi:phosphatase PAP2 family protein [candidate division WWE3 bacterium]|uniref:Phosphatase PAP2 family protein n=1 Tax=candidate division WWE3 bacterium TaxID=2053526 RepID=A0A7X9DKU2_UNCKA|nr:phosphatase PAP2 family protein [candidate division WWE3 bacterium]